MPVLPLIDFLILVAWTCLTIAGVQKAIAVALARRVAIFGITPFDFVLVAGVTLLFALALAGRTWVKANESALLRRRRERRPLGPPFTQAPAQPSAAEPAAPEATRTREGEASPQAEASRPSQGGASGVGLG